MPITSICEVAVIERIQISVASKTTLSFGVGWDPLNLPLWNLKGDQLGIVRDLLYAKWNASELPTAPGAHENIVFVENPVHIYDMGSAVEVEVFAHLDVGSLRYFGELNDAQIALLSGTGPVVTMPEIEATWRMLTAEESPAAQFALSAVTTY